MTAFLIGAALLAAIALGLLLWPLRRRNAAATATTATTSSRQQLNAAIYRGQMAELDADRADGDLDEADWRQARQELQRRLLDDEGGEADAPAPAAGSPAATSTGTAKGLVTALTTIIPAVAAVLYFMLGNPAALNPASHAQMPSMEEIEKMLATRLEQEPNDPQALWFAGTMAFDREDYAGAIRYWERMIKHVPRDSEDARSIARSIEEARTRATSMKGGG